MIFFKLVNQLEGQEKRFELSGPENTKEENIKLTPCPPYGKCEDKY